MRKLYLDKNGDCEPPAGVALVESEVDFLRAFPGEGDILVRGPSLCWWAGNVWLGRGWPVLPLLSPVDELSDCALGAEPGQVAQLYEENVRLLSQLTRPFRLRNVLEAIYPVPLWRGHPSLRHAAEWLVWLDQTDPPPTVLPLLRTQAMLWRATCKGPELVLYDAYDASKARELLAGWLGYGDGAPGADLPAFPLDVPRRHLDTATRNWRSRIVRTQGAYVEDLLRRMTPRRVRERAAEIAFDFYRSNRGALSQEVVRLLADFLTPERTGELRKWLPPPQPGNPPTDVAHVRQWFTGEYLPFRQWCLLSEDTEGLAKAEEVGKAFALWFLGFYPTAISGGDPAVAFARSNTLRGGGREEVTLLVIADGLSVIDAETLVREIASLDSRLTVCRNDIVFAAVPTVTGVCKPALVHGCTPRDAANLPAGDAAGARVLTENQDPGEALRAAVAGDFFIWTHGEPDRTYHSHGDTVTLLEKVRGAVQTIAQRVVTAASAVPSHLRLRIVVTTDHGRLLGKSERAIPVPSGMHSHQRVAMGAQPDSTGNAGHVVREREGYLLLDGRRFGFSDTDDCAVAYSDRAFRANDGKSGVEHFPHGGLAPEEVLISWCEILRDQEPPHIECKATGSAREGRAGQVTVQCVNTGLVDVTIEVIEFQFRDKPTIHVVANTPLAGMSQCAVCGTLDSWPTPSDLRAASCVARIRLPVGDKDTVPVELDLRSEGFYSRDNILGDLT
ncbi:MAG: hypothetical protein GX600_08995 [Dehalococcoidia bacterium]|nr:hypothetical protein [Dehalococcoidia bacterium]